MTTFNIAHVDDWAGLYKDGRLVCEGHRITYYDLLQAGAIASLVEADGDAVEDAGGFPLLLQSVPRGDSVTTPHNTAQIGDPDCPYCGGTGVLETSEGNEEIGWERAWHECDCATDRRIASREGSRGAE